MEGGCKVANLCMVKKTLKPNMCAFFTSWSFSPKLCRNLFGKIIKCGEITMKFGIFFCFLFLVKISPNFFQQWLFLTSKILRWPGWLHSRSFFWEVGSCRIPWRIHGTGILLPILLHYFYWLVVEPTHLKNMLVKMGSSFPKFGMKITKYVKSIPSLPFQKKNNRSNVGEDTMDTKEILYKT